MRPRAVMPIAGPGGAALACIALLAFAPGPAALAKVPGQGTRIELSHGNIEVMVADGTTVAMAPETEVAIRAAATTVDGVTDITVGQGQVHVSTVLARGSGIARVRTGGEVWEIERAAVLIAIGPSGISATMLHGRRLRAPGRGAELRRPGMAMRLDARGVLSTVRPPPGEVAGMMRATGTPGMPSPPGPPGTAGGPPGGPGGAPPQPGQGHDGAPASRPGAPPPGQAPGAFPAPPGAGVPGFGRPSGPGGAMPAPVPGRAIGAPGPRAGGGVPGRRLGPALQQRRGAAAGRAQEAPGRPDLPSPDLPSPGVPNPGVPNPGVPNPGVPSPGVPAPPGLPNAPDVPNAPGLQGAPGLPEPPGPRPDR